MTVSLVSVDCCGADAGGVVGWSVLLVTHGDVGTGGDGTEGAVAFCSISHTLFR